jgi:hypothetical protein
MIAILIFTFVPKYLNFVAFAEYVSCVYVMIFVAYSGEET